MATKISRWRSDRLILAVILFIALVVRLWVASQPHVLQGDEGAYVWLGKSLVTGGGFQFFGRPELHYTPGYPIVAGLAWLVVRDLELASKICFVLFGVLLVIPVYLLSRRLYGENTARLAAGLVAVAPPLSSYIFFYGSMTEPLYFFLVFAGIYASEVAMEEGTLWRYAAAGALFGMAYLTRPEGWIFPVLTACYAVLAGLIRHRRLPTRHLAGAGLLLAAFVLVALPYLLYMHGQLGRWALTGKSWMAYIQQKTWMERDLIAFDKMSWGLDSTGQEVMYHSAERFTHHSLLDEIRRDPQGFFASVFSHIREIDSVFLSKRVLPFFLLPFIGLGLFRSPWKSRRLQHELYLWLTAGATTLALLVFTTQLRFYLGIWVILLLWVAHGVVEFGGWVGDTMAGWKGTVSDKAAAHARRWQGIVTAGLGVLFCAYFLVVQPAAVKDGLASQRLYYEEVGEWLGDVTPPGTRIMSRGAIVAIHAEREWVPFPHAEWDEVLRFARQNDVDYIVVNEHEFEVMRPHLAFLGDPAQAPPALEPVFILKDNQGRTVVYRLKEAEEGE